jgi:predicted esterase
MAQYKTFTTCGDMGPWVSKLILELPSVAHANDVTSDSFNVYVERMDLEKGGIALAAEHHGGPKLPSRGFVTVRATYVCDERGNPAPVGKHVALELPECRMTKRIDGDVMRGYIRGLRYRVTQLTPIPGEEPGDAPVVGLVFDECDGDVCPALVGWHLDGRGTYAGIEMNYGWFEPNVAAVNAFRALPGFFHQDPLPDKLPLVVWLHGAGEGQEPYRTVTGNKVTAISGADIQGKLGGAAYVLAPSSPTFWMDPDGKGEMVDDNQTFYAKAVKALIDEFIADRADSIDTNRIYIGGLSNGGFMTLRMIVDYPGFFAAAVPVCAPWVGDLGTDEEHATMAKTPMWWVQSDDDPIVPVDTHFQPSWERLIATGAQDLHATYFDHIDDADGNRLIGHFVWVQAYNDVPRTDLDGSLVRWNGYPVTLWQWVGKHSLA